MFSTAIHAPLREWGRHGRPRHAWRGGAGTVSGPRSAVVSGRQIGRGSRPEARCHRLRPQEHHRLPVLLNRWPGLRSSPEEGPAKGRCGRRTAVASSESAGQVEQAGRMGRMGGPRRSRIGNDRAMGPGTWCSACALRGKAKAVCAIQPKRSGTRRGYLPALPAVRSATESVRSTADLMMHGLP